MADDQVNDPGPGAKGDAEGGSAATKPANSPDVSKLVSEAVSRAVAEATGQLAEDFEAKLKAQAENHANQVRRLKKQAGGEGGIEAAAGNANNDLMAELEAERESKKQILDRMAAMEAREKSTRIDTELNDALSMLSNLAEGASPIIRQAIRGGLDLNSQGDVIYRDGQKHVRLADKLAELSAFPGFQAPANRGGVGGSSSSRETPAPVDGKKVIYDDDEDAFMANLDAIRRGEVKVIRRED